MTLPHRIKLLICLFAMLSLCGLFALPVAGQEHEAGGHAPVHKTAKEKIEQAEEAHEAAEEVEEPAEHSAKHEAAESEHENEHAEAAEEHEAPAETEHEAVKNEAHAPAEQENYEKLPFMQSSQAEAVAETPSTMGLLMRTTGALLLILGLIAATAWAVRKYGAKPAPSSPDLAVLASLPIGDRQQVTAIRFGNSLLLIGSTAQAMTLLAARHRRPPRPVQVPATPAAPVAAPPQARSVGDMLAHQPAPPVATQTNTQPLPFAQELANVERQSEPGLMSFDSLEAQEMSAIQGLPTMQEQFTSNGNNRSGDLSQEAA